MSLNKQVKQEVTVLMEVTDPDHQWGIELLLQKGEKKHPWKQEILGGQC
jgi:hypothetical protein